MQIPNLFSMLFNISRAVTTCLTSVVVGFPFPYMISSRVSVTAPTVD